MCTTHMSILCFYPILLSHSYVSILSYCPTWDIGRTSQGFPCVPLTCQSYVSILSYCPTWDIGRTSQGFPCVPLTCQSYVSILSYCTTWDIGRTSQGFPCVPLTCQSYVSILSYCPTWDIGRTSTEKASLYNIFIFSKTNLASAVTPCLVPDASWLAKLVTTFQ